MKYLFLTLFSSVALFAQANETQPPAAAPVPKVVLSIPITEDGETWTVAVDQAHLAELAKAATLQRQPRVGALIANFLAQYLNGMIAQNAAKPVTVTPPSPQPGR
jgi:hypothetical protein